MRAYKVLTDGRSAFTGLPWPLPADGHPGEWVHAEGPIGLCSSGVHASNTEQLPHWIGIELWEIELAGEILEEEAALVAERGRLVRKLDAWDQPMRERFARRCLARAEEITASYPPGAGLVEKIGHTIWWGGAAPAGYFCAMLAGESVAGRHSGAEYDAAFALERALQAEWLRRELSLPD